MFYVRGAKTEEERQAVLNAHYQKIADAAYWRAAAAEVRAKEKAERDRERRARAEIVGYLSDSTNIAEMVMARARFDAPVLTADRKVPSRICWMPKGTHEISASRVGGGSIETTVVCDERGANAVIASFAELTREGFRPYIDYGHRECEAAGWVGGFSWDPAVGITCGVTWTPAGQAAIRDRVFVSFSPTFYIDHDTGRVAGLVKGMAAGGLVNNPAFGNAMPPVLARAAVADAYTSLLRHNGYSEAVIEAASTALEQGRSAKDVANIVKTLSGRA